VVRKVPPSIYRTSGLATLNTTTLYYVVLRSALQHRRFTELMYYLLGLVQTYYKPKTLVHEFGEVPVDVRMYWQTVVLYDVVRVRVCHKLTKRKKKFQREVKLPNYIYYCMCS
jgi:hypothetical protein